MAKEGKQISKQHVEEIIKCGKDPAYFLRTYGKIVTLEDGLVPFELFDFQEKCLKQFQKHRFNIVLKSRQLGLTTVSAGYAVWVALFQRNKSVLCIATKLSTATGFIKKVKEFWKNLPPWLRFVEIEETKQEVRFMNGSTIEAIPTSDDAGRGKSINLLIVDEAAFIRNFDSVWTAIQPTLGTGGNAIVLSTPNGAGNMYYDLWVGAEAKQNSFNPIKLPWNVHPDHDQAWFDEQCRSLDKRKVAQELLCEFLGSGETFLNIDLMSLLSSLQKQPIKYDPIDPNLWIWEDPQPGVRYAIASDVSRGDSKDFSTFQILNVQTGEIAGEYQGKITPDILAGILFRVGVLYNRALIVVESNSYGNHTLIELKKLNYTNIFYQGTPKHLIGNYMPTAKDKAGFFTHTDNRLAALTNLEECVRLGKIIPRSVRLYNELQTFVWSSDKKPSAIRGKTDDLVMAIAILAWIFKNYYDEGRDKNKVSYGPNTFFIGMSTKKLPSSNNYGGMLPSTNPRKHLTSPEQQDMDPNDLKWLYRN